MAIATVECWLNMVRVQVGGVDPTILNLAIESVELDELSEALARAFEGSGAPRPVEVLLHEPLVQLRTLTGLPAVRLGDLNALVANQRDRFFRHIEGEVVVTAEWLDTANGVARAALARQGVLESLETALSATGRAVRRFVPVTPTSERGPELVTPRARSQRTHRRVFTMIAAAVVALSGWLIAGGVYVVDLYRDDRTISEELGQLDAPLKRIQRVSDQISSFTPIATAFHRQSIGSAWALERLVGVSEALPSNTHLHRLTATRGAVLVLEAHGPDALDVVTRLEQWWPGRVQLKDTPQPDGAPGSDEQELFTVLLDAPAS